MDINLVRSLVTAAGFCCFLGIIFWAYSKAARKGFEEAAMLPFMDGEEMGSVPVTGQKSGGDAS
ncbi:cbb3-type cytochrome oxidase subunit 3 [Uliginosibacterium paludis]|uniref:CcoQ/FixQ family Cbb3-type cytochrome c oxidase assembly chaperone n=1 Tax=Uliginosibacterium paludis TaxID=1615952 RepID=A0ABV2CKD7_9RHOO